MDFLQETQPDFYRPQLWYCELLTPIWQQREKYGLKGYHFGWSHDTMDARTACDLLEKAFLSPDTPIWVPDPGFNFVSLYYLRERGMSIEQVKAFLRCFNAVVREKLLYPNKGEVSPHLLENLRISCQFDQPVYPDMGLIEVGDSHASISESQVLTEAQRYQLLVEWNDTRVDYPRDKCNHQLFEDHAGRTPEAAALVYADQRLTYRKVNHLANRLARHLQTLGVGPDVMVGICLNRSLELVIALLGVLKAGGAYVPLDSTYPKERLATMLEDADMLQVLLTKENLLDRLPAHKAKVVCLDNDWEVIARESTQAPNSPVTVHNLVYVIFTSGSTGRPKGAGVYHSGWTNLMNWFTNEFNITPLDKVLVISSFGFDITQRSLAMPLIVGGELHLLASDYYDPQRIIQTIFNEKITLLNCSPSTFYPLIEDTAEHTDTFRKLSSLRCLFLGGEAISASRLHHWAKS
ncbi:MAG: AMP-binding protein, partial [Candidatus Aminicenantes bacterium]